MKCKFGIVLMVLGLVLMLCAGGLLIKNNQEAEYAELVSSQVIPKVVSVIQHRQELQQVIPGVSPEIIPERTMTVSEIDGYGYIGFVTIPALELELPVMADWSYPQLRLAPCRYTGGTYSDDLVIMAHNYRKHFARLSELRAGDTVIFTDMDAVITEYQVAAMDVLSSNAIEEMTAGNYDLTLFTCTYGGENRVTLRCNRLAQ